MKKNILLSCALAFSFMSQAQMDETTYIGAFAPAPTPMWTEGWTEWNPDAKVYGTKTVTVSADITTNTTWNATNVYEIPTKIYVTNNATLTIEPGTIIRGSGSPTTVQGALIITRGSKIMAEGTASAPIVFTSNAGVGERSPGDWGGLIILGSAPTNQPAPVIEGGLDAAKAAYGGTNADDNSGVLKYVRIEYGGIQFQPDQEINGLTMGGVGRGTVIDYVQCSFTNDDSFEWFGGTVNAKHLVAYRGVDDDFDSDFGWSGMVQYGIGIRDPELSDQCACSSSEGFESDNDAAGSDLTPRTQGQFKNMTSIGPLRGNTAATVNAKFERAARIRRNSQVSITQSLLMDWPKGGLHLDGVKTEVNARDSRLLFTNNVIAGIKDGRNYRLSTAFGPTTFASQGALDTWFNGGSNKTYATTAGLLTSPYSFTSPDYRPLPTLVLGLNESGNSEINQVSMFPNPAANQVEVIVSNAFTGGSVNILNSTGVSLITTSAIGNSVKLDVSGLANGLYIVSVNNGGKVINKTLVINK